MVRFLHGVEHVVARRNFLEETPFTPIFEELPSRPTLSVYKLGKHILVRNSDSPRGKIKE